MENTIKHTETTPSSVFAETMKIFKLKAVNISEKSGVDIYEISKFKNGHKDINSRTLAKLLKGIPYYAQCYFWNQLLNSDDCLVNE